MSGSLRNTTVRELSKFLGLVVLQQAKNSILKSHKSYEVLVHLDSECLQEVQWWKDNLIAWNRKALLQQSMDLVIEADASHKGWGAYYQGVSTGGRWLPHKISYHINCLKLFAYKEQSKSSGTIVGGKHFSSNLHKQNGRDTLPHVVLPSQNPLGLVPQPQYSSVNTFQVCRM